jgi:GAF domain-containing protein/DNA-binding CsgD family transcriptional regulator
MADSNRPGEIEWLVGGALRSIGGLILPADGRWAPRLVSDVPPVEDLGDGDRIVAEVIDELADSRLNLRAILTTVTRTLSRLRPGTWVAVLMNKDPSSSIVVAADEAEPALAHYVDRYVEQAETADKVPTSGLTKRVIDSGVPVFEPNLSYDQLVSLLSLPERDFFTANQPPVEIESIGLVIVPMRARGAVIGTIGLFVRAGMKPLTEEDAVWLQAVADRTAVAIENAQLYGDAIRRLDRLTSLQGVGRAIAASSDLRFTLKVVLDQVTSKLEIDAADVLLLEDTDRTLVVAASTGFLSTSMPDYRLLLDESLPGRAVTHRRTELFNAMDDFAHARRRSLFAREGFKAYGAVPLFAGGNLVGVLEVFHRSPLNQDDESLAFLDAIGSIAAIAIDNAGLKERVKLAEHGHRPGPTTQAPEMTRVEKQILAMLVEGLTNREISAQVHLSPNTVKFHVRRLLEKAKTANRTELARKATQEGWI